MFTVLQTFYGVALGIQEVKEGEDIHPLKMLIVLILELLSQTAWKLLHVEAPSDHENDLTG